MPTEKPKFKFGDKVMTQFVVTGKWESGIYLKLDWLPESHLVMHQRNTKKGYSVDSCTSIKRGWQR